MNSQVAVVHGTRSDVTSHLMGRVRAATFPVLSSVYLTVIFGVPLAVVLTLVTKGDALILHAVFGLLAPVIYASLLATVAGLLSLPHQKGVVPGLFPRSVSHPVYFHRRLYGLCWTSLYYCTPVYYLCLSLPLLKRLTFRLFGYRGSMAFTVYPDTWIRDLPLLHFGRGVYVSNRATLGTNIVTRNGGILMDEIRLDEGSVVGHLTMLGPGVRLDRGATIGVGCGIGIKARIGERAKVGAMSSIGHGVQVGRRAKVGDGAAIEPGVVVDDGVVLPRGAFVPVHGRRTPAGAGRSQAM